jgi:carboxyl-terminal processing protease
MSNFFKARAYVLFALVIFGSIFFAGFSYGKHTQSEKDQLASIINKDGDAGVTADFAPFWKAWRVINEKYVPTNPSTDSEKASTTEKIASDQTRVYGAISGMVASLGDPYTVFFPPVESKSFNEEISGNFEGVGMEVSMKEGILTVVAPLKGTPAFKAGIKAGDKILKIDARVTNNLTTEEAITFIKGKKGTTVTFTIVREGVKDPFEISVVRDVIDLPTIDTEINGDVFIIRLYNFSAISPNLFRNALRDFVDSGKYKMIVDLRGNPGGYLEAAIDMASWFLPVGEVVVKEDFKNEHDVQVYRSKGYNIFTDKLRLAILIDGGSASASEILAGALHDNGVGTLVGTKSFGKGSVQELVDITPETSLKVTIAKWLTPNGLSISNQGLVPDIEVKLDEEKFKKDGTDTQLLKAIEILNK